MSGSWILVGSNLEKYGNFRKNGRFSGRIWPDWGNAAWADMAGLGSIGLNHGIIGVCLGGMSHVLFISPGHYKRGSGHYGFLTLCLSSMECGSEVFENKVNAFGILISFGSTLYHVTII